MPHLKELYLHNNLLAIPPEILGDSFTDVHFKGRGSPANPFNILQFYFDFIADSKALNQAKIILVGQPAVGKTCLVNRIVYNTYNDDEDPTRGLEIHNWSFLSGPTEINVKIWDLGGQEIMHATHQFFLTKRSLYILVLDSRVDILTNRLEYWLRMLESFGGGSPTIVVCNKSDQFLTNYNWDRVKDKFPFVKQVIPEISCKIGLGISSLRQIIVDNIISMDHVKDRLPSTWFNVIEEIENLKMKGANRISLTDYKKLCVAHRISDEREQERLIWFLNDLGVMLYYGEQSEITDTSLLNPKWITKAVYKVINDSEILKRQTGLLTLKDLKRVLLSKEYPRKSLSFIVGMMKRFELCFEMEGSNGEEHLIPGMLGEKERYSGTWSQNVIFFEYRYDPLPASIIARLIVRLHSLVPESSYWRNGVLLKSEEYNSKAIIRSNVDANVLSIITSGETQFGSKALLRIIRTEINEINYRPERKGIEARVPLADNPNVSVSYLHLLKLKQKGINKYFPEGYNKEIDVVKTLNTVDDDRYLDDGKLDNFTNYQDTSNVHFVPNIEKPKSKHFTLPWWIVFSVFFLVSCGLTGSFILTLNEKLEDRYFVAVIALLVALIVIVLTIHYKFPIKLHITSKGIKFKSST